MSKKLIQFPKVQEDYINKRAKKFGVTYSEYIRNLVMIEMMEQESLERHKKMEKLLKKGVKVEDALKQSGIVD